MCSTVIVLKRLQIFVHKFLCLPGRTFVCLLCAGLHAPGDATAGVFGNDFQFILCAFSDDSVIDSASWDSELAILEKIFRVLLLLSLPLSELSE